jgi:hypothetical protein
LLFWLRQKQPSKSAVCLDSSAYFSRKPLKTQTNTP